LPGAHGEGRRSGVSRPRAAAGASPFFGVYVRSGHGPFWWRACGGLFPYPLS
jgi:hypothetical protein